MQEESFSGDAMDVILSLEDMDQLEKRFGPKVRQVGPLDSDGDFSYVSIPAPALARVAYILGKARSLDRPSSLDVNATKHFFYLLELHGSRLIDQLLLQGDVASTESHDEDSEWFCDWQM